MLMTNTTCLQLMIPAIQYSEFPFGFQVKTTLFTITPITERPSTRVESVWNQNLEPCLCLFSHLENKRVEIDVPKCLHLILIISDSLQLKDCSGSGQQFITKKMVSTFSNEIRPLRISAVRRF